MVMWLIGDFILPPRATYPCTSEQVCSQLGLWQSTLRSICDMRSDAGTSFSLGSLCCYSSGGSLCDDRAPRDLGQFTAGSSSTGPISEIARLSQEAKLSEIKW